MSAYTCMSGAHLSGTHIESYLHHPHLSGSLRTVDHSCPPFGTLDFLPCWHQGADCDPTGLSPLANEPTVSSGEADGLLQPGPGHLAQVSEPSGENMEFQSTWQLIPDTLSSLPRRCVHASAARCP